MLYVQDWDLPFSKPFNLCTKELLLLVYAYVQVSLPECVHLEESVHKCVQVSLPICVLLEMCAHKSVHIHLEDRSTCLIVLSSPPPSLPGLSLIVGLTLVTRLTESQGSTFLQLLTLEREPQHHA